MPIKQRQPVPSERDAFAADLVVAAFHRRPGHYDRVPPVLGHRSSKKFLDGDHEFPQISAAGCPAWQRKFEKDIA
jgi:hypothetical protein